jgi:hypothetical protein
VSRPAGGPDHQFLRGIEYTRLIDANGRLFGVTYSQNAEIRQAIRQWARSRPVHEHEGFRVYRGEAHPDDPGVPMTAPWARVNGRYPFIVHFDDSDGRTCRPGATAARWLWTASTWRNCCTSPA